MTPIEGEKNSASGRALILRSALQLFSERGYDGTSIDDIRQAAGFKSKASLYTHFKSKEEVSSAILQEIQEEEDRVLMQAYATARPEPLAQFAAMGRAYVAWSLSHRQEYTFCFVRAQMETLIQGKPDLSTQTGALASDQLLLKLVQELRKDYPVRAIADTALLSMIRSLIGRAVIDQEAFGAIGLEARAQQLIEVCMSVLFSEDVVLPA
ncbi:TetR/AcrR family transcriptional regulator [Ktedonosporobacter rubrisoli]|uniref:TetR/AcrR family transcriptional regulator n=1 Tax=Ktedonosporobacter rubrisoli TaxID=2509675 RepID=A0A4P6JW77_KTERU|nr:TetR/AcrR family transcriptional regulator [Ktedonosporobacter rubrisoli]QBD79653.1 TetR/AcrR family transcriptional regulator [Ktedonosporobacter rubrisoli]